MQLNLLIVLLAPVAAVGMCMIVSVFGTGLVVGDSVAGGGGTDVGAVGLDVAGGCRSSDGGESYSII